MECDYILQSDKLNRFYIGYTSDFDVRLEFHEKADKTKFPYNANDWELFFKIECENKMQALAVEKHIKSMRSKIYVENLKKYPEIVTKLLIKYTNC